MSAIYCIDRFNGLFNQHRYEKLNYVVNDNNAVFLSDSKQDDDSTPKERISYYDIKDIDISNCSFNDFCKALKFVKESVESCDYDEKLLTSLGAEFDGEDNDYWTWISEYIEDIEKRGDIQLYHKVRPMVEAAWNVLCAYKDGPVSELTENGFFAENTFVEGAFTGTMGIYRIGSWMFNMQGNSIKADAVFDYESTSENPKILVSFSDFPSGNELQGQYIVDINEIDYKNMTPVEMFAYLTYSDYMNKDSGEIVYEDESRFNMLMDSGVMDIESFSDFTDKTFNLLEVTRKAKDEMEKRVKEGGVDRRGQKFEVEWPQEVIEELRQYFQKCIETFDDLLLAIGDSEETE